jgi:hypothetical protein
MWQLSLYLIKHHALVMHHKVGTWLNAQLTLALNGIIRFMSSHFTLEKRALSGQEKQPGCSGKQKNFCSFQKSNRGHPSSGLLRVLTKLLLALVKYI